MGNELKILQVYPGSYEVDRGGGVSTYVKNISRRLAENHDVTVYATNPGYLPRYEVVDGVKVERYSRFAPGKAYFFSLPMLYRILNAKYDVVHGHSYHTFPMHYSVYSKEGKNIISTHFHGVGHSNLRNCLISLLKPFGGQSLRKADDIVAVSQYEKYLLLKQFPSVEHKIRVIPNGVDYSEFQGAPRADVDETTILYVGRLEEYKGIHYLVEAMPYIEENIVLNIVGKGSLKNYLLRMVDKLGLEKRVRFYQDLSREELISKYYEAKLFVLLSKYEAYSLVVADALASGTTCIVADTSALTEWIDDYTCFGIEYPPKPKELVELINKVFNTSRNDGKINKNKNILDWTETVSKIEELYFE